MSCVILKTILFQTLFPPIRFEKFGKFSIIFCGYLNHVSEDIVSQKHVHGAKRGGFVSLSHKSLKRRKYSVSEIFELSNAVSRSSHLFPSLFVHFHNKSQSKEPFKRLNSGVALVNL